MDGNKDEFGSKMMEDDKNEKSKETKSRLKRRCRRPKASRNDIMKTIASDVELLDDVWLMNSVEVSQIKSCVKKQDLNVSDKKEGLEETKNARPLQLARQIENY